MMREQYGKVPLLDDIFRMSERVGTMLERVLTCSLGEDAEGMKAVLRMDDEVDVICEQIYRECIARQGAHQVQDSETMTAISIAQYLEHVGDHAVNWARWWLYFNGGPGETGDVIV